MHGPQPAVITPATRGGAAAAAGSSRGRLLLPATTEQRGKTHLISDTCVFPDAVELTLAQALLS